ncbi:UNVERIFIED_CONTAM: hypothetical protein RMT77_003473 [Armadillidium vulgare]
MFKKWRLFFVLFIIINGAHSFWDRMKTMNNATKIDDQKSGIILKSLERSRPILRSNDSCRPPNDLVLEEEFTKATAICNQVFVVTCPAAPNNITWKFNNETLPESKNSYRIRHVELKDAGIYSCSFFTGKEFKEMTLKLFVIKNGPYCGPPQNMKVSPPKRYALRGETSWTCSGYVGEFWSNSQFSLQVFAKKGDEYFLLQNGSENVILNTTLLRNGVLQGELKINVSKYSPREFLCRISNQGKFRAKKFFLVYGVTPQEKKAGIMRAFSLCLCASFAGFLLVCYWWNFRHSFNLLCIEYQRKTSSKNNDEDRTYFEKLCIVHGHDVDKWLFNYFLPTTESCIGYKCYLPIRDMKAGQSIIEEISLKIPKCERIFIIISKCLFKSDYSSLATRCAVRSAVARRGKVFCILFENFNKVQCNKPEDANLMKALKSLSSVKYSFDSDVKPIPEDELGRIVDLVIYVRGPNKTFCPTKQREKFVYHGLSLKDGKLEVPESCADNVRSKLNGGEDPVLYTFMEVKEYGKHMLWRLLWCQLYLAFRGTSEQRFWFQILILLPSLSLPLGGKEQKQISNRFLVSDLKT